MKFSEVFGGNEVDLLNSHPGGATAVGQQLRLSNLARGMLEAKGPGEQGGQITLGNLQSATAEKYAERTAKNQVRAAMTAHERPDRMFVEQLKALIGGDSYELPEEPPDAHAPMESRQELQDMTIKYLETVGPMQALKLVLSWMEHELTESPKEEALEHALGITPH
jgi:hypothetical protein